MYKQYYYVHVKHQAADRIGDPGILIGPFNTEFQADKFVDEWKQSKPTDIVESGSLIPPQRWDYEYQQG